MSFNYTQQEVIARFSTNKQALSLPYETDRQLFAKSLPIIPAKRKQFLPTHRPIPQSLISACNEARG